MVRNKHNTPGIVKFSFWRMTADSVTLLIEILVETDDFK